MARTTLFRTFTRLLQHAHQKNLNAEGEPLPPTKTQLQWTRRRFIKYTALAGGAAIATHLVSQGEPVSSQSTPGNSQIAIVGGGIAGLNAAYQLKKAGLIARVYEAKTRVGGRIKSRDNTVGNGLVTDLGGSFINSDHEDILALVEDFDLTLFNRLNNAANLDFPETAYFFDGELQSEGELAEKLRPLARQISRDANALYANFEQVAPTLDALSVKDYLDIHNSKIPDPFVRELVENSIRTEYGVEPNQSSALQLLFSLPTVQGKQVEVLGNSDEAFFVQGGSERIIDGLANALSGQIQTERRLTRIQARNNGYRLTFNNRITVDADYVILAMPFVVLREVDIEVNLPQKLRRFINQLNLGLNEKVFAGFDRKPWRQANGFVLDVWSDRGFSSAWDETQRQTNRQAGAITFYLGGNQVETAQSTPVETQGRQFVAALNQVIPGMNNASNDRFFRTNWSNDPFIQGGYSNFKPGQLTEFGEFLYIEANNAANRQDVHVGNLIFAGEHLSDAYYGFMNGAAETGRLAAEFIQRQL